MDGIVFDQWNEKKKITNYTAVNCPYFMQGQIWWAQLGQNIATEVAGKGKDFLRPVLILRRVYENACLVIPLTSQERKGNYYFSFCDQKGKLQCALLTQIRYLDGKRLKYQYGGIKKEDFANLQEFFCLLIKK